MELEGIRKSTPFIDGYIKKLKIEKIKQPIGSLMEQQSVTDEIRKYKDLLDEGIITEEEFTIKKKNY